MRVTWIAFLIIASIIVMLAGITWADVNAFYRQEITWNGYNNYVIRYDNHECQEYNYNNGDLPQDLLILNMPIDAVMLPNSYAEVKREGILIQIDRGSGITRASYSPDSMSFDLPRSGTTGNCTGAFYLAFTSSGEYERNTATTTTTTLPINETTTTTIEVNQTTTTVATNQTASKPIYQPILDIIDSIVSFFTGLF